MSSHSQHPHTFDDTTKWAAVFEDSARDTWQKPEVILKALRLRGNEVVADIGSATGYFSTRFARAVPRGKVYGVDIETNLVDYLKNRARREKLGNLTSLLGTADDPRLPERADIVFICDTYHHIEGRKAYFADLKKSLKRKGRIVIVDFKKGKLPIGPPDSMKLSEEQITVEMAEAGYERMPLVVALPYQYALAFTPAHRKTSREPLLRKNHP